MTDTPPPEANPLIQRRIETIDPDAELNRPPLRLTVTRVDDGDWAPVLELNGIFPDEAIGAMVHAARALAMEVVTTAGGPDAAGYFAAIHDMLVDVQVACLATMRSRDRIAVARAKEGQTDDGR